MYVYINTHTRQRVERGEPVARFDRSERWELVEAPKPKRARKTTKPTGNTEQHSGQLDEFAPDEREG